MGSMLMNSQSRKSKICSSLMTEPSLSLIHAERNPRNSVVQEPEQDTKSLTVKCVFTVTTCPCSTRTAPQVGERHLPCYIFLFTLFIANKLREQEKRKKKKKKKKKKKEKKKKKKKKKK